MARTPEAQVREELCQQVTAFLAAISQLRHDRYNEPQWLISYRIKTTNSTQEKLARKRKSRPDYSESDLTDLAGVRVLVDGLSASDALVAFLHERRPFEIVADKSEDFRNDPRADGYRACHFVMAVSSRVRPDVCSPVELQIRTMLQHQWALLSNAEFYKSISEIPPALLSRMRALSEILHAADIEADQLRRNRILDEAAQQTRSMLRDNLLERLGDSSVTQSIAHTTGLAIMTVVEIDVQLRRALVSGGDVERRAFAALETLCAGLSKAEPTLSDRLGNVLTRTLPILLPIPREPTDE